MSKDLFFFVGEASGDRQAGLLMDAMPDVSVWGVAGPYMREHNVEMVAPMEEFQLMGFTAVFKAYLRVRKRVLAIRDMVIERDPAGVMLVDSPGINLRLAKMLRKKGYTKPIMQYVSPTVWAWRKGRIKTMTSSLSHLFTIFPFESKCFNKTSLAVSYVGHPLASAIGGYTYDMEKVPTGPLIGIFPGSRRSEVENNLPLQLAAAAELDLPIGISCSSEEMRPLVEKIIKKAKIGNTVHIIDGNYRYELMKASTTAVATSGTVTLELALHGVPTVVTYHASLINKAIARLVFRLKLPYYCITNILASQEIFPELIARMPTRRRIAKSLREMHTSGRRRLQVTEACTWIRDSLLDDSGLSRAASTIRELCHV